jgi:hypothetical protein
LLHPSVLFLHDPSKSGKTEKKVGFSLTELPRAWKIEQENPRVSRPRERRAYAQVYSARGDRGGYSG